jgi:hypothetical protein
MTQWPLLCHHDDDHRLGLVRYPSRLYSVIVLVGIALRLAVTVTVTVPPGTGHGLTVTVTPAVPQARPGARGHTIIMTSISKVHIFAENAKYAHIWNPGRFPVYAWNMPGILRLYHRR